MRLSRIGPACAVMLAELAALAALAPVAARADATPLTINIPVTLTNIDRDFDEFTVDCQLQYSAAYAGAQFPTASRRSTNS